MKMRSRPSLLRAVIVCLVVLAISPSLITPVSSVAVMSVDLGSEWMKIAVVTPGVPMEIALNRESKRKTAAAVSLRGDERTFGSDALSDGVRYPKTCYAFLLDLLGKPFEHPQVQRFRERFPQYEMLSHPERGTVMFRHSEDIVYTVEELVAMILEHAKSVGEHYTEQKIKDAVVTVPAYFSMADRQALLAAADLAGVNVLQLISEPMAVALNYGMFRRKEVNATAKYLMFYDMGSQDTTVSIVSYQTIKTKERGYTETHPQAQILGLGYDRNLGGTDLQVSLREYLADEFNALGKTKTDVRTVPRAMAKLFKEAGRVKTVLSANTRTYAQVENVMEDIDFRHEVKREKLLELNEEWFSRVTKPIDMALETAAITIDEISEVILVGAGTRVPRVQELLVERLGRELGKSLNTDEAAAMGAVYKAADLSTGFKVKKFLTKEAVIFPIDVDFEREYQNDDGERGVKQVKRSLFPRMNPFPQKKIMTFNKHVGDFAFHVNLNELDFLGDEVRNIGSLNLTSVTVTGVSQALDLHAEEPQVESKGVKAHFSIDDSGLLSVTSVESVFEKTITVEEQEAEEKRKEEEEANKKKDDDETKAKVEGEDNKDGGWANLGDTISSFFNKETAEDKPTKDSDAKEADKKETKDKKDSKDKDKKKKPKEPKIETIKESLEFSSKNLFTRDLSEKQVKESKEKLRLLNERDELKQKRETALNNLESFVIDVRDKLYQDVYEASSTEEERESFSAKCSEISDWIDEEVMPDTEVAVLEEKLKELKDLTASWFARVREHLDRPEALGALDQMLNTSSNFLVKAKNKTGDGDDALFTEAEVEMLEKKLSEVQSWRDEAVAAQEIQPKSEMPKLTTGLIAEKALDLDREVKYLLNKAKIAKAEKEKAKKEAEEKAAKEADEKKKKDKKKKKKKKDSNETTDASEEVEKASADTNEEENLEVEEGGPASESADQVESPEDVEMTVDDAEQSPEVEKEGVAEQPSKDDEESPIAVDEDSDKEEASDKDTHVEL